MDRCTSCDAELTGPYCASCGEAVGAPRRESLLAFLRNSLRPVVSADSRAARSFRALILQPGVLTRDYMDGRRRRYLNPLELFLLANLLFFVVGGLTRNPTLTTSLGSQLCCQIHSPYANREVGRHIDLLERGSWIDATRDTVTEAPMDPATGVWTLARPELERFHTRYRLIRAVAVARFETRFNMSSEQSARTLVIAMVPLFALVMALLEPRRGSGVRHLVFALHVYAFTLLWYMFLWLVQLAMFRLFSANLQDSVTGMLMMGAQALYVVAALGPAYGDARVARVAKGVLAGIAAFAILQFYRFLLFLVAFNAS